MGSTTAQSTIDQVRLWFAAYGLPKKVFSDNGPQFISQEFTDFGSTIRIMSNCVNCHHVTR